MSQNFTLQEMLTHFIETYKRIELVESRINESDEWTLMKKVHAPTFPGVGGCVTKCLIVYNDATSSLADKLADRPFVTKKHFGFRHVLGEQSRHA